MTEREWEKFFDLIEKIVELRDMSVNEKCAEVVKQAKERGGSADMNFEEFTAWDFSMYYE